MSILGDAKEIADLIKKVGDVELYRKIVELEGQILELTRQKRDADEKIETLTHALSFKDKLTFKSPAFFADGDPVPYCAKCWEGQKLASHLTSPNIMVPMMWKCPQCKTEFFIHQDPRQAQKEVASQPQVATQKPPDFVEHRGALFKSNPKGGYFDDALCRKCRNPMVSFAGMHPFACDSCGITVNFCQNELQRILTELPR